MELVPVDHDPFASAPAASGGYRLQPVDHDPFAAPAPQQSVEASEPGALSIKVRPSSRAVPDEPEPAGGAAPQGAGRPATFDQRFAGDGPATVAPAGLAEGMRARADEALIGPSSVGNSLRTAASQFSNTLGLNIPRNAAAGAATVLGKLGASGFNPSFEDNYRLAKEQDEALDRQNPGASWAGFGAGLAGGAMALPAWTGPAAVVKGGQIVQQTTGAGRIGRAAATGFGYGAAGEFADSKDAERAGFAGLLGGALGGGFGLGAEGVSRVVSRLRASGVPFRGSDGALTDEAVGALREAGIDPSSMTPELTQAVEAAFTAKGPSTAAAREALAADQGISLSRGQATADPRALGLEGRALTGQTGGRAQSIGQTFEQQQAAEVAAARERLQGMAAGEAPRIEAPQEAFGAVADRARQAAQQHAERESIAQRGIDDALRGVRGRGGTDALDGATTAVQGVRDAAEQARGAYRAAYGDVAAIPGEFAPGALDRLGSRVRSRLGAEVPVDEVLTPAATRALRDLDNLPDLFRTEPGAGPNLQQLEQVRKRLVSYRGSTGQNPTDRRAVDRILAELDGHVEDAMAAGLFGPRSAPRTVVDDFPGTMPALEEPPAAGGVPAGQERAPETLVQFLGRQGGIALDGDARAGDLQRVMTGTGPLARRNGRSLDDLRPQLIAEGYLPPDRDGGVARNIGDEVHELIRRERAGEPAYRIQDRDRAAGLGESGRGSERSSAYAEEVGRHAARITADLDGVGIRPHEVDPPTLRDAAEAMLRGEHIDGLSAYEAAATARGPGERASAVGDVPFDGPTSTPASDSLPGGDTAPAEAMRRARGLFRDYQQAFKPRGPGDVAGQRLQAIVERDASPNEVAAMLFGSPGSGKVNGGQVQTLGRLREAVGADSDTWKAVQQSLIARHLGGEGQDLGRRMDYLLRGEGRTLTSFLTEEQRAGLGRLRAAVGRAEATRTAMPEWVTGLERQGFDPNAIGRSLFGSSGPLGAKPGAANEARAAKGFLGGDSEEWAMLRQAAVQRLTDPAASAGRVVDRVRDFTDGSGSGLARELFDAAELGHLRRFSAALQATIRPDGSMRPEAASGLAGRAVAKALDMIAGAVAFKVGGISAAAGTYGARVGQRALVGGVGAMRARQSFGGGAPRMVPEAALPLGRLGVGAGIEAGQ